jgi:hypothetical protein
MHLTFFPLTALLTTALALPSNIPRQSTPSFGPTWSVTNFNGGCSPGGCILTLNVSYTPPSASTDEPAFAGYCLVNGDEAFFQPCTVQDGGGRTTGLLAQSLPGSGVFSVEIVHEFTTTTSHSVNVTGTATVDFETTPLPAIVTVGNLTETEG